MTIKVIEKGHPRAESWRYTTRCIASGEKPYKVGCGSKLEYGTEDVFRGVRTESDYQGSFEVSTLLIKCPECHFKTDVTKEVPAYVSQFIPSNRISAPINASTEGYLNR